MSSIPLVLVSGVSGYIGSWVAYCLLKQGYKVRGTVRSLKNEAKVAHLRDLCPESEFKIELVEADLTSEKGWSDAVAGCTFVLHVASPFPTAAPAHKDDLIRPAVDGTMHVLRAAAAASPRPKRVVVTSSFASVGYGQLSLPEKPFNEDNFTVIDDSAYPVDAYTESKARAERAAWDFWRSLPEGDRFELATVNPTFVQGPMLSANGCSSADIPKQMLMGEMPALVDIDMFVCHVYDVAKVHLLAMTVPEAAGHRFIVHSGTLDMKGYARVLHDEFKDHGYKVPLMVAPTPVVWLLSWWDKQARNVYPNVSKRYYIQARDIKKVLKYDVVSDGGSVVLDMAHAAIGNGIIPDKSVDKVLSSGYSRPQIDLSMVPTAKQVAETLA